MTSAAFAEPSVTPSWSIDFNGSGRGPASWPTCSGRQGFNVVSPVGTTSLSNTYGADNVTISLNPAATGSTFTSRDRGAHMPAASDLLRDFAMKLREVGQGLGDSYVQISIGGMTPGGQYEFTGLSEDQNSAGPGTTREGFRRVVPTSTRAGVGPATSRPRFTPTPRPARTSFTPPRGSP